MTSAADGDPPFSLLMRLLNLPDGFFEAEAGPYTRPVFRSTCDVRFTVEQLNQPPSTLTRPPAASAPAGSVSSSFFSSNLGSPASSHRVSYKRC
jgi:hypothetical protein